MKKMTVGELIDELSTFNRDQLVSVYLRGLDLRPYKFVETADEKEVCIYAAPVTDEVGADDDLANAVDISTLNLSVQEWAAMLSGRFTDEEHRHRYPSDGSPVKPKS
ncbi:hypothetical protein [Aeromonas sp. QDB25]|uniref:hypothetical protein n=1 Tax=Aeromonas sp. QDB25 TaxID=2989832 RepID=UPI0022E29E6E|nr:hypothetical protein [Aeromonas sp. QDB25]